MASPHELVPYTTLADRIRDAAGELFADQPVLTHIYQACSQFENRCRDIVTGRGLSGLTLAVVGAKGQGKTWVARQFILDPKIQSQLPSGVLSHEATTKLHWIGANSPPDLNVEVERFVACPTSAMIDLGASYTLLDTPGVTDSDVRAVDIAQKALSLTPVQILVIRRDQLRASTSSPIVNRSEGALCIPVITAVSPREVPVAALARSWRTSNDAGATLASDLQRWLKMLHESAPNSKLLEPILLEDFEATGDEAAAGERLRTGLAERLSGQSLTELNKTLEHRLAAAVGSLKHRVSQILAAEVPQLSRAVQRLVGESQQLPNRVVESVLGSPIILETAVRTRLRTQIVADTSPIWFPYRTTISLLSMTQGAWDRLVMAMTGSIPSIFGTLVSWAKNMQQSRNAERELQQGIHDRLTRRLQDQLGPLQQQFHRALSKYRASDTGTGLTMGQVNLRGIEELQSRSQSLFESLVASHRTSRWLVTTTALVGTLIFWGMLVGPIVLIYREYFEACYRSLVNEPMTSEQFPHPKPSMLATSVFLSFIPLLIFSMIALASFLKRSKIERIARTLVERHHGLVSELQSSGILRLEFEDSALEKARFLLSLETHETE